MELNKIKVYRIGPIAAFDKSAHSVARSLLSYYFSLFGLESYLYLRSKTGNKNVADFFEFLGIPPNSKFKVKITGKHKGLSSIENLYFLLKDLANNRNKVNLLFLSKSSHVNLLSRFKKFFNFKIIFENHQDKAFVKAIKSSDLTYVVSPQVYEKVKDKKVILWNYHYPVREDLFKIRKTFKTKDQYTIGYVGSLNPEKGLDILLKSLQSLKKFRLKIIGGNEKQISRFKLLAKNHHLENRIIFTGFLPQGKIANALKEVDILVAPFKRTQTTIPLKIYEYLATGIPIVASNIPAVKIVGKEFLFYFEPQSVESLNSKIQWIISNPESVNRLLEKSYKYAQSFRWNTIIERILKDVERII